MKITENLDPCNSIPFGFVSDPTDSVYATVLGIEEVDAPFLD